MPEFSPGPADLRGGPRNEASDSRPLPPTTRTRWSSARPEHCFTVDDPATARPLAVVQGGGEAEVDAAVRAAHEAYATRWRWRPARERGRLLLDCARLLREHADELAALESRENGKPVSQARQFDLEFCIGAFEFFGGLIDKLPQDFHDSGPVHGTILHEPHGVVGCIIPFNWPPIHLAAKCAPALAMGNAVVIKPPEQAPLTILRIAALLQSVLPDDVVHVVPGPGPVTGAALAGHPLVRKLSFTGASPTGTAVLKLAADHLTPALVELGGKNPFVIFADADLDQAVAGAVEGAFFNQGQACTAASRILVHRSVHDTVVERLARATARLRVGDGADPATHVGPLVTRQQQERVQGYIALGLTEGATIAAQAPLPDDPHLRDGFFVAPTLFTGVRPTMRIAREEIFGPVTCALPFDSVEEAVAIANGTDYGLVAGVYTRDHALAMRVSREIEAGVVFVNNYHRALLGTPFGGTKASGYGREHAVATLREFGRSKAIRTPSGIGEIPRWSAVDELLG